MRQCLNSNFKFPQPSPADVIIYFHYHLQQELLMPETGLGSFLEDIKGFSFILIARIYKDKLKDTSSSHDTYGGTQGKQHKEWRCNQGRCTTIAKKPSQHEFINVKKKSALPCFQKRNWDTSKPLLSQPANLHPANPCHGSKLSLCWSCSTSSFASQRWPSPRCCKKFRV